MPISEKVHFDQLFSAVLADYLSPVWLAILVGMGPVRRCDAYTEKSSVATPTRMRYLRQRAVRVFSRRAEQACIVVSPPSRGCTKVLIPSDCFENLCGPIGAFVPVEANPALVRGGKLIVTEWPKLDSLDVEVLPHSGP